MSASDSKILLIDDQPAVHRIVKVFLEGQGLGEVESAFSSPDAVRKLSGRHRFSAVICERYLQPMNALDLRRLMLGRPDWAAIPMVVMLRVEKAGDADALAAAGIRHWIAKPFAADQLVALLRLAQSEVGAA
jgi:CheY-like chemotaxis protein